jgi:hypothetical protein
VGQAWTTSFLDAAGHLTPGVRRTGGSSDAAATKAQASLNVSQKAIDGAPHFADNNHDVKQPPQSPSDDWRGKGWKP